MAAFLNPQRDPVCAYHGLDSIFEYINDDGRECYTNCGQAAAATFLTHHGKLPTDPTRAGSIFRDLERRHPPDNFGGAMGTSQRRVAQICRHFGLRVDVVEGEEALRFHLSQNQPVIVMLGVPGRKVWRMEMPAGHWMVAYGWDDEGVHLTNWGKMTWDEFRQGWQSFVPRLIGMRMRGLVSLPTPART